MTILLITYLMLKLKKAGNYSSPNMTSTKMNSKIKMVDGCSGYSFAAVVLVVLDVVLRRNANKIVANLANNN